MGKPVLFGPTIHNSLEALMLKERGAGIMINDGEEMAAELIKLLSDNKLREKLGNDARAMIEGNAYCFVAIYGFNTLLAALMSACQCTLLA